MTTGIKPRDHSGEKYNQLLILEFVERRNGRRLFRCRCDCGNETVTRIDSILSGHTRSCGCAEIGKTKGPSNGNFRHGLRQSLEFKAWATMRQRCLNPRNHKFADYGGRGITVCDRWNDFATFYADMGPKPTPAHTIDRIDNDGPYSPENCRWATAKEQANNRRPWRRVTKSCIVCGREFHPIRTDAKFCGGTCNMRMQRAIKRRAITKKLP